MISQKLNKIKEGAGYTRNCDVKSSILTSVRVISSPSSTPGIVVLPWDTMW
jgi:hypothetical protein